MKLYMLPLILMLSFTCFSVNAQQVKCAWILWERFESQSLPKDEMPRYDEGIWTIKDSFENIEKCKRSLEWRVNFVFHYRTLGLNSLAMCS